MHGLGAGLAACLDDALDHQVGFGGRRGADMHRLVGHLHVQRIAVGVGEHGHGPDAHPARRLDDATGDLAAVGDEDFLEHTPPGYDQTRESGVRGQKSRVQGQLPAVSDPRGEPV